MIKFFEMGPQSFLISTVIILNFFVENSYPLLPYTVTRFEGLVEYYHHKKHEILRQFRKIFTPEIDVHRKWEICTKIFHSKFGHYEHPSALLIYPPKYETQIRSNYRRIYDELFVDREQNWWSFIFRPTQSHEEYTNPSKKRKIRAEGFESDDYVFACLVREEDSGIIRPYYVSRDEYNMNEARRWGSYLAGRFIFVPDEGVENRLSIFALAEESPNNSIHRHPDVQEHYSARRTIHAPALTANDDPICSLDAARRLRLCTSTFMYELIHWKFQVVAGVDCVKKHFAFWGSYPEPRQFAHAEWMIECFRVPAERSQVYISRAYRDNEVFVFLTYNDDLMIHYLSRRVTVVKDSANYSVKNKVAILRNNE